MATTITYTDLQDLSCEFKSLSGPLITRFIGQAERRIDESFFGDLYDDAVMYLTAHLLSVVSGGSAAIAGPITSKTAGSLSIGYGSSTLSDSKYGSTSWGREFQALMDTQAYKSSMRVI